MDADAYKGDDEKMHVHKLYDLAGLCPLPRKMSNTKRIKAEKEYGLIHKKRSYMG